MPHYDSRTAGRIDLGEAFMEYFLNRNSFIASKVAPIVNSGIKAGNIPVVTREDMLRNEGIARAPGGRYARDDYSAEDLAFSCVEYGIEVRVGDDQRAIYKNDFDADMVAVQKAASTALTAYETRMSTLLFNASTWTGTPLYLDTSVTWETVATATPISDVQHAVNYIAQNSGVEADTLIINRKNLGYLLANQKEILPSIQYVKVATWEERLMNLAACLGLRKVYVNGLGYHGSTSTGEGITLSSLTPCWSDSYAMVCKTADSGSLTEPCVARSILFAEDSQDVTFEVYREEQTRSDVYRVRHTMDELVMDKYMGFLLKVD